MFRVSQGTNSVMPITITIGRFAMEKIIVKDPKILGGEPVFRGTRVPFKILTDYLEGGDSLDDFLEQYPSVTREAAVAAIEEARMSLVFSALMIVLLDECAPKKLKLFLTTHGHACHTVQEAGWSGIANGELLALAEPFFDVLVSIDKGLQYQQNIVGGKKPPL